MEGAELAQGALIGGQRIGRGVAHDGPETGAVLGSSAHELRDGRLADATGGIVDDALECLLVVGVDHDAEVGDDVLHLFALVERLPAVDPIGDALLPQRLLEDTRLGIGAIEHGKLRERCMLLAL